MTMFQFVCNVEATRTYEIEAKNKKSALRKLKRDFNKFGNIASNEGTEIDYSLGECHDFSDVEQTIKEVI